MKFFLKLISYAGTGNESLQELVISPQCIGDACEVNENVLGAMLAPATTYRIWMVAVGRSTTNTDIIRAETSEDVIASDASFLDNADLGAAVHQLSSKVPTELGHSHEAVALY